MTYLVAYMLSLHTQVAATDVDSGLSGEVSYRILSVSNGGRSKFDIDPRSGQVYVTQLVDRGESYVITVEAEDNAPIAEGNTRR